MSKRNLGKQAAAALKYNPDLNYAPVVVASGLGELAKKIINIADENGVPVYRDDSTAALLVMLNSGETIPVELYRIIAAIVLLSSGVAGLTTYKMLNKEKPAAFSELFQQNQ